MMVAVVAVNLTGLLFGFGGFLQMVGLFIVCGTFAAFSGVSLLSFYQAWQTAHKEMLEGGQHRGLEKAIHASKVQFTATCLGLITGFNFLVLVIAWILLLEFNLFPPIRTMFARYVFDIMYTLIFLDSICNDACTHFLAKFVDEEALTTALEVRKERAARAAE